MTMPFYVAPEQVMKDRAEYAQKGIARGRALVATIYDAGVLIVAENPSRTLHKISEIYDRVAFAGVGKYNEFDQLRVAGVRHADTKGFAYSREDVDARSLANLYAQYLGQVFTHEMKPLEVEILVAELDPAGVAHQLYHIAYDGTVVDETGYSVLGGDAATITERLGSSYDKGWTLGEALRQCIAALAGPGRTLGPAELEVAVLTAGADRRSFRRVTNGELEAVLSGSQLPPGSGEAVEADEGARAGGSDEAAGPAEGTGSGEAAAASGGDPAAVPGAEASGPESA
jgi:proteasome alpha subunit